MGSIAFYPGSFDPITNGHLDIIQRACSCFDVVHVGVGVNNDKRGRFLPYRRVQLIHAALVELGLADAERLHVLRFSDAVWEAAKRVNADVIVRGLRALSDFEFEQQFAHTVKRYAPQIEPVFLMTRPENSYLSSSLVWELAGLDQDVSGFVPQCVVGALPVTISLV